jgi:hypothetical protein
MIEDITLPGLVRLPVYISGEWAASPKLQWDGSTISDEPIVAVSFLRWEGHVEWCLSERPSGNTIQVRLGLTADDKNRLHVQVFCSFGGGSRRWGMLLSSSEYTPEIPFIGYITTGRVVRIWRIEGKPSIDFLALFLARRDVKSGRAGMWHLRPRLRDGLPPQLWTPLTYGRTGTFDESEQVAAQNRP